MDSSSSVRHEDATVESSDWNVTESSLERIWEDTSTCRGRCDGAENAMTALVRNTCNNVVYSLQGHVSRWVMIYTCTSNKITGTMSMLTSRGIERERLLLGETLERKAAQWTQSQATTNDFFEYDAPEECKVLV